jgi:hypothetical protein
LEFGSKLSNLDGLIHWWHEHTPSIIEKYVEFYWNIHKIHSDRQAEQLKNLASKAMSSAKKAAA